MTGLHEIPDQDYECGLRIAVNCKALLPPRILHVNDGPFDENSYYTGRDFHDRSSGARYEESLFANKYKMPAERFETYCRHNSDIMSRIQELRGKTLRCFCRNENPLRCHGNVLLKLLNESIKSS